MGIESIDKNFKIETSIDKEGMVFYDAKKSPFSLHGVYHKDRKYRRLPESVGKESGNEGVVGLSAHTGGGRVRFKTDSPYVAIKTWQKYSNMNHMPLTGVSGFDLYVYDENRGETYVRTFVPPACAGTVSNTATFPGNEGMENGIECRSYESLLALPAGEKTLIINFPLYTEVYELAIGLDEKAIVKAPAPYTVSKPVVFYGSSITQGGCASRPGNNYMNHLSRRYDMDFINLGFSGSAKGEPPMREYIAGIDMSAFILDYDFNAPSLEHLQSTHEPLYKRVRESHPDIPIVMISRPVWNMQDSDKRNQVIKTTYENAVAAGDKNVYYIPGYEMMEYCGCNGTVDGTHPNDLGFYSMAKRLARVLDGIFTPKFDF